MARLEFIIICYWGIFITPLSVWSLLTPKYLRPFEKIKVRFFNFICELTSQVWDLLGHTVLFSFFIELQFPFPPAKAFYYCAHPFKGPPFPLNVFILVQTVPLGRGHHKRKNDNCLQKCLFFTPQNMWWQRKCSFFSLVKIIKKMSNPILEED